MQARKIDLTPYTVELESAPRIVEKKLIRDIILEEVDPKRWLRRYMGSPLVGHTRTELFVAMDILGKIRSSEDNVLLEEADWKIVCRLVDKIKGFGIGDYEILQRVLKAPKIEVKEE